MHSNVNVRFRTTVWPEQIVIPERMFGRTELNASRDALIFRVPGDTPTPPEAYLALYAVDLDDLESIETFAKAHGHLDGAELKLRIPADWILHRAPDEDILRGQREATHATQPPALPGEGYWEYELLQDFRFAARVIKDMTSAWRVISGQVQLEAVTWHYTRHDDPVGLAGFLSMWTTLMLSRFGPTLELTRASEGDDGVRVILSSPARPVSLYEVCAIELFNHIAGQATYKTCANETCDRLFVVQHGRSRYGQHRTIGSKYHSDKCARAQAARQLRRRRRRAKNDPSSSSS